MAFYEFRQLNGEQGMPAYYFEGVNEPGFEMSGIVEAADESGARLKALRFCSAIDRLQACDVEPCQPEPGNEETGAVNRNVLPPDSWKKHAFIMAVSIWEALRQERHFRPRKVL